MAIQIVECTDLPRCEPNISQACFFFFVRTAFVSYEFRDGYDRVALVRFDSFLQVIPVGPNDEAFTNHRFSAAGLMRYTIQEIINSPWIAELSALLDRDKRSDRFTDNRHFVLALNERCVDIAARSALFVGEFDTHIEAMAAAVRLAGWNPASGGTDRP